MKRWMIDEWTDDGKMDEGMVGVCLDEWMDRWMDGQTDI